MARTQTLPKPQIRCGGRRPGPPWSFPAPARQAPRGTDKGTQGRDGWSWAAGEAGPLPRGQAQPAFYYFDVFAQAHSSCRRARPVCLAALLSTSPRHRRGIQGPAHCTATGPERGSGQAPTGRLKKTALCRWERVRDPVFSLQCSHGLDLLCALCDRMTGTGHCLCFGEGPPRPASQSGTHRLPNPCHLPKDERGRLHPNPCVYLSAHGHPSRP